MTILLHFERSEACAEAHGGEVERVTIPFDSSDGSWVQVTYNSIRTQDGTLIAMLDEKDGCWFLDDVDRSALPFSDVVIEFVDHHEAHRKANFERLQTAGYNPHKLSAVEYETALELLDEQEGVTD